MGKYIGYFLIHLKQLLYRILLYLKDVGHIALSCIDTNESLTIALYHLQLSKFFARYLHHRYKLNSGVPLSVLDGIWRQRVLPVLCKERDVVDAFVLVLVLGKQTLKHLDSHVVVIQVFLIVTNLGGILTDKTFDLFLRLALCWGFELFVHETFKLVFHILHDV